MSHNVLAQAVDVTCMIGGSRVLSGISIDLRAGELLALVGPNGAGKSTLLSVLSGDATISGGSVELAGRPIGQWSAPELARQRSVLLQSNQVSFGFTVRAVIDMGRMPWVGKASAAQDQERVARAIADTDVAHLLDRPFPQLSGGEKARVSLARVLAQDCPIIMLDEPTAALDVAHSEAVMTVARNLSRQDRAVVVVLHDLSLAAAYADRLCVIDDGRRAALGAPEQVLTQELLREVYDIDAYILTDPGGGLVVQPRRAPVTNR